MIRVASTVANSIAVKLISARRLSIEGLERELDAYVHAMIDWSSVCTGTSMEVDQTNKSIRAMLPGSTAAIGPAKSERSDQLREIAAEPSHASFDNRRLCR